jgi:hypothetical protein
MSKITKISGHQESIETFEGGRSDTRAAGSYISAMKSYLPYVGPQQD